MKVYRNAFVSVVALTSVAATNTTIQASEFNGKAILAISDGAMLASGYIDGKLGTRKPDRLTIVSPKDKKVISSLSVSNSVGTWPNIMAISPDGKFAVVTEPWGQPTKDAKEFKEIPKGKSLSLIDLSDLTNPKLIQTIESPYAPSAVDFHPDGNLIAVTFPFKNQLGLYPFENGKLGKLTTVAVDENISGKKLPLEFKWHPSGKFAAITLAASNRVVFYAYENKNLKQWGDPMVTAPLPGKGQWTKDGKHFLITTITATGDLNQNNYRHNTSLFAVFQFDQDDKPNSPRRRANDRKTTYKSLPIQHSRVSQVPNGMGYVENFAISPDGKWVVGLNMVASWLPKSYTGRTTYSELTLFAFDQENGTLTPHSTTKLDSIFLPQGIVFDKDGSHIAVTSFQHDKKQGGSLNFYKFSPTKKLPFEKEGAAIPLPRGAHFLSKIN